MEYTSKEQDEILTFWQEQYIKKCKICGGTAFILDKNKKCTCANKCNASYKLELNNFGRKYLLSSLEESKIKNEITKYFSGFLNYYSNGKGLLIFGKHSTGKTLAVHVLAKNIMENILDIKPEFNIHFFLYDDLVRFSYDDKSFIQLEKIVKKTNILILDNVGNETGLRTQARSSVSLLENILRNREIMGKPTIITTTVSPNDLKQLYSEPILQIIRRNNLLICSNEEG